MCTFCGFCCTSVEPFCGAAVADEASLTRLVFNLPGPPRDESAGGVDLDESIERRRFSPSSSESPSRLSADAGTADMSSDELLFAPRGESESSTSASAMFWSRLRRDAGRFILREPDGPVSTMDFPPESMPDMKAPNEPTSAGVDDVVTSFSPKHMTCMRGVPDTWVARGLSGARAARPTRIKGRPGRGAYARCVDNTVRDAGSAGREGDAGMRRGIVAQKRAADLRDAPHVKLWAEVDLAHLCVR